MGFTPMIHTWVTHGVHRSPGSKQQPLHPDTPWTETPPLYAAFIALQDVALEMGPTLYLPGTHTKEVYTLMTRTPVPCTL